MLIGVDVGGTNTDAVLMDGATLLAKAKCPTSGDVTSGVVAALEKVLPNDSGQSIEGVMLGTTHFTNALLEQKGLAPTAVVRLALPATQLLPPLVDWPDDLKSAIGGFTYMASGGHEFDGREISSLDYTELKKIALDMRKNGVEAIAMSGVFSPVDPTHERQAGAFFQREMPHAQITLSNENGRMGILERENAATLNACLGKVGENSIRAIKQAMESLGLTAPLYLSQNDGTLMDEGFAARFPVFAIASGPTNSMRGAAYLSGLTDCIVVDVGGTTTDVGALTNGFPREASLAVNIAGVRTNFRMPDVVSIALGGGSIVNPEPLVIGPESVGFRLEEQALVFGGNTLTATDIAVAGGLAQVGDPTLVSEVDSSLRRRSLEEIQRRVETVVDQVKLSPDPVPIVLVGGGSLLVGESMTGADQVLRPDHGDVANAIGAAIAQVGGQVEKVFSLEDIGRGEALASIRSEAIGRAVAAGAEPTSVEVVELDEIPLTYLPGNVTLIRAKAVGDLGILNSG